MEYSLHESKFIALFSGLCWASFRPRFRKKVNGGVQRRSDQDLLRLRSLQAFFRHIQTHYMRKHIPVARSSFVHPVVFSPFFRRFSSLSLALLCFSSTQLIFYISFFFFSFLFRPPCCLPAFS
jgi:hypothetical protein